MGQKGAISAVQHVLQTETEGMRRNGRSFSHFSAIMSMYSRNYIPGRFEG